MPATDFFESLVLGHALLQQPFSITDWYVGLWTSDPTSAGLLTGEVAAADYARQPVSWDATFANSAVIAWPNALADWGDIDHVAVLNSPVKGSGNMLGYQSRAILDINPGLATKIPIGGLVLTLV